MLRGERVTLRPKEPGDMLQLHPLFNREVDLVMCAGGDWRPRPLARMEYWFKKRVAEGPEPEFVIEIDGKAVGDLGLHPWQLDHRQGTAEIGIGIYDPEYINKGYGREAMNLLLDWAFVTQNLRRVWLTTPATNQRAVHSYRACGFVQEGRLAGAEWLNGEYVDMIVMGLLRTEWEAIRAAAGGRY